VVGRTLPAAERADWVMEWSAEMRGEWLDLEERGRLTTLKRAALVRRCLGALVDAAHFWIEALLMTLFDFRTALRAPLRDLRTIVVVAFPKPSPRRGIHGGTLWHAGVPRRISILPSRHRDVHFRVRRPEVDVQVLPRAPRDRRNQFRRSPILYERQTSISKDEFDYH
jgi:hypothetical protein